MCVFNKCFLFFLLSCGAVVVSASNLWRRHNSNEHSRSVAVFNKSGLKVDIFWVNVVTGNLEHSNTDGEGIPYGGMTFISSYVGHTFEIQELKDRNGQCRREKCESARFTVNRNEDQEFTLWKNFTVTFEDHHTRALQQAEKTVKDCLADPAELLASDVTAAEDLIQRLSFCVDERVKQKIEEIEDEIAFQAALRVDMGKDLTKYVCLDESNSTLTKSLSNLTWSYTSPSTKMENQYNIRTLFNAFDASSAMLVEDFVSEEQCEMLQKYSNTQDTIQMLSSENASGSHPKQSYNTMTTRIVPGSAKIEIEVVEVLLKMQGYIKSTIGQNLSYRGLESLLTQYVLQKQQNDCDDASTENGDGQCALRETLSDEKADYRTFRVPSSASVTVILFCSSTGGAVHFPRTGVHLPASDVAGGALFLFHTELFIDAEDGTEVGDIYMGELAVCFPQHDDSEMNIFMNSFSL